MYVVQTIGALGDAIGPGDFPIPENRPGGIGLGTGPIPIAQPPSVNAIAFASLAVGGVLVGALGFWAVGKLQKKGRRR